MLLPEEKVRVFLNHLRLLRVPPGETADCQKKTRIKFFHNPASFLTAITNVPH